MRLLLLYFLLVIFGCGDKTTEKHVYSECEADLLEKIQWVKDSSINFLERPDENAFVCISERNFLDILLNYNDRLLVEGRPTSFDSLANTIELYVDNNGKNPSYSDSTEVAILSFKADSAATKKNEVFRIITEAYNNMRMEYSLEKYNKSILAIDFCELKKIIMKYRIHLIILKKDEYYPPPPLPDSIL